MANRYSAILEDVFLSKHKKGQELVTFTRDDLIKSCKAKKIAQPKNLGDIVYSFRYRKDFPESIAAKAPSGKSWVIKGKGRGLYAFVAVDPDATMIRPRQNMAEVKIPDATPGVIAMYALTDEQALLAIVRYNRLIDVFAGAACYSLQNHLRSTVKGIGQIETDEIYVGINRSGTHFIFPVQAKGGKDVISTVQIEQDFELCAEKFPRATCRPIAAQFIESDLIALFEFAMQDGEVKLHAEKHYRLVEHGDIADEDLALYRR